MRTEMVFRNVTEEDERTSIEVSVRLTNNHFESHVSAPMGDADAARAAIEAWENAMLSVLKNPNLIRREAINLGGSAVAALPETLEREPKKRRTRIPRNPREDHAG